MRSENLWNRPQCIISRDIDMIQQMAVVPLGYNAFVSDGRAMH